MVDFWCRCVVPCRDVRRSDVPCRAVCCAGRLHWPNEEQASNTYPSLESPLYCSPKAAIKVTMASINVVFV